MMDDVEHSGEVLLEGGIGGLCEQLGRETFGGYAIQGSSVHLDLGLQDEVGQSGETGYAVLEGKPRTHWEDAEVDLL